MVNKVYQHDEAAIIWTDTTGTLAMTLNNLAASGNGRQGAVKDFGTAARAGWFAWRAWFKAATAPVVDEEVRVYAKTSDGTHPDNDDGTGNIVVSSADKLKNLLQVGTIVVDEAATAVEFVKSGLIWLPQRYFMPLLWNATADNFEATNNVSGFSLTPVPSEIQ